MTGTLFPLFKRIELFGCNIFDKLKACTRASQMLCSILVIYSKIYMVAHWHSGIVFTNGPGDRGSIPGEVIPKTQKMVLDAFLLNTQHFTVLVKGKRSNPQKGIAPSPTPQCCRYWKGSLWVSLDNDRPTYLGSKLAAPDALTQAVKMMSHIELWDAQVLSRFASMACCMVPETIVFGLPDLVWLSKFF